MKLFKKLCLATVACLALGCGTASANVVEHVHVDLKSGATFNGDITFADQYASILGVDGYLDGGSYGNDHLSWNWNTYYHGADAVSDPQTSDYQPILGAQTDLLMDGDVNGQNYKNLLAITWQAPANSLVIDFGPQVLTNFAGVGSDPITGVTVGGAGTPSNVPEPASMVLLGLGLAGLAVARRRKA